MAFVMAFTMGLYHQAWAASDTLLAGQASDLGSGDANGTDSAEGADLVIDPSCAVLTSNGEVQKSTSTGIPVEGFWSYDDEGIVKKLFVAADVQKVPSNPIVRMERRTSTSYFYVSFESVESVEFLCDSQGKSSVEKLEDYAFRAFTGGFLLDEIKNLDKTQIVSIGRYALSGQSNLKTLQLPSSLTSIGDGAFSGCSDLEYISLPSPLTSIGDRAFEECTSLTSIEGLAETRVLAIEDYTFSNCRSLRSIDLPKGLTSISWNAFDMCSSLDSVIVSSPDCASIDSNAFDNSRLDSAVDNDSKILVHRRVYPAFFQAGESKNWRGRIAIIGGTKGSIVDATISGLQDKTYSGKPQTQSLTVKFGDITLKKDTDYSLSYSDNVKSGWAIVTVTGKGDYVGEQKIEFYINSTSLSSVSVSGLKAVAFSGKPVTPKPVVKLGKVTLKEGVDYDLMYSNNYAPGTARVRVYGKNSCYGSAQVTFNIVPANVTSFTISKSSFTYNGQPQWPSVKSVKSGNLVLGGRDCTFSVLNAKKKSISSPQGVKNAGTYYIRVTGVGYFKGSKLLPFKIVQASNKATAAKTGVNKALTVKSLKSKAAAVALPKVTTKFGKPKWKVTAKDKKNVLSLSGSKIMVKKGAKKGTYAIKLKASVAKTKNYKAASTKAVTVKVTVK